MRGSRSASAWPMSLSRAAGRLIPAGIRSLVLADLQLRAYLPHLLVRLQWRQR